MGRVGGTRTVALAISFPISSCCTSSRWRPQQEELELRSAPLIQTRQGEGSNNRAGLVAMSRRTNPRQRRGCISPKQKKWEVC